MGTDEEDSSSEDDNAVDEEESDGLIEERDANGNVLRLLSSLVTEKIPPLSAAQLPMPMCSRGGGNTRVNKPVLLDGQRGVRFAADTPGPTNADNPLKKQKVSSSSLSSSLSSSSSSSSAAPSSKMSGLEHTVREMLINYQPSSAEKRPYWCRICRVQSSDIDGFDSHMQSEMHLVAFKMERKMSYCRICRKQFNSPEQLKEHLKGKLHSSTIEKSKQRSNVNFS